tara:strand:+ start:2679 stop:3104 length:426 start_codon:yes stop_codon:yes gene_type:complete
VKRSELKKIIKPLVSECIKECIYEEGALSGIISEVVKGIGASPVIRESVEPAKPAQPAPLLHSNTNKGEKVNEQRKRLADVIGKDSYGGVDIFEGITPMNAPRSPEQSASSPLGDVDPSDPGIDISGIVALGANKWKAFTQ